MILRMVELASGILCAVTVLYLIIHGVAALIRIL